MNVSRTALSFLSLLVGLSMATTVFAAALDKKDLEFMQKAAIAGNFEIQSSELAKTRATDPTLKSFAEMMVIDHTHLADGLTVLAQKKTVTLPTLLDDEHGKMLEDLSREESNEEFDQAYAELMDDSHDDAVDLFEDAAKDSRDADIQAFAQQALPVLKMHQQHADKLD